MFENIINFFRRARKKEEKKETENSKDAAKERLHLVLMQDRANVSADFLELMKQEIIEVIKKYIEIDEAAIDVRLTNKENEDGTNGAPALYANIPIKNIKNEARKVAKKEVNKDIKEEKENNKIEENTEKEQIQIKSSEEQLKTEEAKKQEVQKDETIISKSEKDINNEKDTNTENNANLKEKKEQAENNKNENNYTDKTNIKKEKNTKETQKQN